MSNEILVALLITACCIIVVGVFYIIGLNRQLRTMLDHFEDLHEENWELRRANRYFKNKNSG